MLPLPAAGSGVRCTGGTSHRSEATQLGLKVGAYPIAMLTDPRYLEQYDISDEGSLTGVTSSANRIC
jgi:hypothetical protein